MGLYTLVRVGVGLGVGPLPFSKRIYPNYKRKVLLNAWRTVWFNLHARCMHLGRVFDHTSKTNTKFPNFHSKIHNGSNSIQEVRMMMMMMMSIQQPSSNLLPSPKPKHQNTIYFFEFFSFFCGFAQSWPFLIGCWS